MKRTVCSSGGAVMLSALFALVLVFIFLGSLMTLNALRAAGDRHASRSLAAYYAARAGIEAALHYLEGKPGESGYRGNEAGENAGYIYYVHFHERGDGRLEGAVFEGAECEVSWIRNEYGEYIMESTGKIPEKAGGYSSETVYARIEEAGGRFFITGWFE